MCRGWHDCKFSLARMFVVNCDQHAASLCRAIVACTRCTGSNELPISRRLVRLVTRCVQSAKVGQHVLEGGALAEAQRATLLHAFASTAREASSQDHSLHLPGGVQHLLPLGAGPAQLRRPAVHGFRHAAHGVRVLLALLLQAAVLQPLVEGPSTLRSACASARSGCSSDTPSGTGAA